MEDIADLKTNKEEKNLRINLWFHPGNVTEERIYGYLINAKKSGKQYMQYIGECILACEEGDVIKINPGDLDTLADKITERIGRTDTPKKRNFES